jgi:hypothetical protein
VQLAEIGYKTYTRINAIWLETDDCVNSTGANCQEGLTVAHLHVWKRIAASEGPARGYLVLEEDVTFHEHFCTLFPRYMAQVRRAQLDRTRARLARPCCTPTAMDGNHAG